MKHYIQILIIEVTRRCNLACSHCMRGDQQNIDINTAYIDKLLDDIARIGTICFTGGEPSLNTLAELKRRNIELEAFQITTNGVNMQDDFLELVDGLFDYCTHKSGCILQISIDSFHPACNLETLTKLRTKSYFKTYTITSVLDVGNAKSLSIHKEPYLLNVPQLHYEQRPAYYMDFGTVYLTATGYILLCCDYEYTADESISIGNLQENSLCDILAKVLVKMNR